MPAYSYEEIYEVMKFMAKVVNRYGDKYLPIFERLHDELKNAERRKKSIDLANQIAISEPLSSR